MDKWKAPIVLLPGLDGTGRLFEPMVSAVSAGRQTFVASYPVSEELGYDALTDCAEAFLPETPCALLAESFSGPIGVRLAEKYPERVLALVLAASFVAAPYPAALAPMLRFAPSLNAHLLWVIDYLMASPQTPAASLALFHDVLSGLPDSVTRARLREILHVDARSALAGTKCPILILRATQDRLLSKNATETILSARPDAQLVAIDAPHLLLQSAPMQCAEAIEVFLDAR